MISVLIIGLLQRIKYWTFIKNSFFTAMTCFSCNVLNINSLECVSMNNQDCKIRSEIINVNTNEPMFYPYSIQMNKCKGSCNILMTHMISHMFLIPLKR